MPTTLAPPSAGPDLADIQGLVARSYAVLPHACYVVLRFGDGAGARRWVGALRTDITPATRKSDALQDGERVARNVAFTHPGLRVLGLDKVALESFLREFQEGMDAPHRRRVLGDEPPPDNGGEDPWEWGRSTESMHALLFLFACDAEGLEELYRKEKERWEAHGVGEVRRLDTITLPGDKEHFGFHDGIAQPRVEGFPGADDPGRHDGMVPTGEVVLGYTNAYGCHPDTPSVPAERDPRGILPELPYDPDYYPDRGPRRDLGLNGSYVVLRQLEQDVKGFWEYADGQTKGPKDAPDPEKRKLLAARMVGRWPNGAPLIRYPTTEPAGYDPRKQGGNDFLYVEDRDSDPHGDRCPMGSHIRRCNPRDSMDPGPKESLLVSDRHRLLRRGRSYGRPLDPSFRPEKMLEGADGEGDVRGLHFICLNTDLARQFEFVQNTWVNSFKFEGLYSDPDPLVAAHQDPKSARAEHLSDFTVQGCPVRDRHRALPRFVQMRGGGYFFLPGMRALEYLASLD